jgi:hypothetical protein
VSRIDSLTQMRVRLTHTTTQVSPTSLERIQQAWAGVPMNPASEEEGKRRVGNHHPTHAALLEQVMVGTVTKGFLCRLLKVQTDFNIASRMQLRLFQDASNPAKLAALWTLAGLFDRNLIHAN